MNILDIAIFLEEEGILYSKLKLNLWLYDKIKPVKAGGGSYGFFNSGSTPDNFHSLSML
jgi:hypothetical protein